jgi:hypothetical protein
MVTPGKLLWNWSGIDTGSLPIGVTFSTGEYFQVRIRDCGEGK